MPGEPVGWGLSARVEEDRMSDQPDQDDLLKQVIDAAMRARAQAEQLETGLSLLLRTIGPKNINLCHDAAEKMAACRCTENHDTEVCTSRVIGAAAIYGLELMFIHMAELKQANIEAARR